jgi:beta-glucosidase
MIKGIELMKLIFTIIATLFFGCSNGNLNDKDKFITNLLSEMTLMEKIGQLNQYSSFFDVTGPAPNKGEDSLKYEQIKQGLVGSVLNVSGVKDVRALQKLAIENSRLKIPLLFALDVIHGYKTISPIPLAESASWNLGLIQKSASMAAREAAASGINWTFAPMVDISRDARWGRVMEGGGEDPYLGSKIAVARINGFQGNSLNDPLTIAACAKHFAAYGFAESGRDYNTVDIGLQTLNNIVLPPFKASAEAGVATFMNSFNELNGVPATGSKFLQRDILKGKWDYKGLMVSDWGSIGEMIPHGFSKDLKDAARHAILAGSDMDMMSSAYIKHLNQLVKEKTISIDIINDAVIRVLGLKYDLGLFSDPYRYCNLERENEYVLNAENRQIALEMAKESIVLLKNEKNILPLKKSGLKIALVGALAKDKDSPLGNWKANGPKNSAVSVLEGLKRGNTNILTYQEGPRLINKPTFFHEHVDINDSDTTGTKKALNSTKDADVVIAVLGEHGLQSGEGRSRTKIDLPGLQMNFLKQLHKKNKNIILVLMNGRPLDLSWIDKNIPVVVEAWQLGTMSGEAISSVLYGEYNPSGKLPVSFPRSIGQVPIYYNYKNTGRPGPGGHVFWSHYNDEKNNPLYPFGYGLSYSSFNYSDLNVEKINKSSIKINFKVINESNVIGEEVVQLYIRDLFSSITRPVKELKRFRKVEFVSNEEKTISFTLNIDDLGYLDNDGKLQFEEGDFEIMVGGSSNTSLSKKVTL